MSAASHEAILRYFDEEARRGRDSPPWAHCYVWAHRQLPFDNRRDLGDFGVREDYDQWVLSSGNRMSIFAFPRWLSAC